MDGRMVAMAFAAGALGLAPAYAHDTQKEDRTVRQIPASSTRCGSTRGRSSTCGKRLYRNSERKDLKT